MPEKRWRLLYQLISMEIRTDNYSNKKFLLILNEPVFGKVLQFASMGGYVSALESIEKDLP